MFWEAYSAKAYPSFNQPCDTLKWNFNHIICNDPVGDWRHFSASKRKLYDRLFFL